MFTYETTTISPLIYLTGAGNFDKGVIVNKEQIESIDGSDNGCNIRFISGKTVMVKESIDEIWDIVCGVEPKDEEMEEENA